MTAAAPEKGSEETPDKAGFYCSFCAKSQREVAKLIAGPAVFICDECVGLCDQILAGTFDEAANKQLFSDPEVWPTERHLRLLEAREQLAERAGAALQKTIDILRRREVSWAVIGGALGVSRQAAWERFG